MENCKHSPLLPRVTQNRQCQFCLSESEIIQARKEGFEMAKREAADLLHTKIRHDHGSDAECPFCALPSLYEKQILNLEYKPEGK